MSLGIEKYNFVGETPLHYLPAISEELGVKFYIKRDDLSPWGAGGNKLRKLEYLLKDAVDNGYTMILTVGGAQTNHGRLTAAMAAKYGLKCAIAAIDEYPGEVSANILLDRIMGCDVILKSSDGRPEGEQLRELCDELTKEYEAKGDKVYFIPVGGSNALGALGYYDCAVELNAQAEKEGIGNARVVCAVGSIGTYLGLFCGLKDIKSKLSLTGIAISPFDDTKEKRVVSYLDEVKTRFGMNFEASRADMDIQKGYTRSAYNNPCKEVREAIYLMARKEAVLFDPCYTGKAFAGFVDMIKEGKISKGETVIFVHTGGFPGLYTKHHRVEFEKELIDGVRIIK